MTKKIEKPHNEKPDSADVKGINKRKRLLARVAGQVASGIVGTEGPATESTGGIAEISLDIAEAILQMAGL